MKKSIIFAATFFLFCCYFPSFVYSSDFSGYAFVSGYVKDKVTGEPISTSDVKLTFGTTKLTTKTNAAGHYKFSSVPVYKKAKPYLARITVSEPEYRSDSITAVLISGKAYRFDFFLTTIFPYPVVRGRVTDSETHGGISNAVVSAASAGISYSAVTDAEGQYVLRIKNKRLKAAYSVDAQAPGYGKSQSKIVTLFPNSTVALNFMLREENLGVTVSPDSWPMGYIASGSAKTMGKGQQITVTNSGTAPQTYSLMVISPSGWSASQTSTGKETYILNACFANNPESISWNEINHALSEEPQKSTEIKFAADQAGIAVSPAEQRLLWLQFKAPTTTSVTEEQRIEVIINAEFP